MTPPAVAVSLATMRTGLLCLVLCFAAASARADDLPAPKLIGPRSGSERDAALSRYGGDKTTEAAVAAGLDWLVRHAEEGGGWDADGFPSHCAAGGPACTGIGKGQHGEEQPCPFDAAISGLAALAFLGHGILPDPEGDATAQLVDRSLARLEGGGDAWARAIATEAFAEAEVMERKGRWLEAARHGARQLLDARGEDGAWGYAAGFRPGSDVPFTAFVVSALVAARDVGVELPADLGSGVDAFLNSLEEEKGRLAYLKDGRGYGYTPTGSNAHGAAAIRELLQFGLSGPRHHAHMALVAAEKPVWQISFKEVNVPGRGKFSIQVGNLSLYQWYYGTLACFQAGGSAWSDWFGKAKTALLGHQEKKGCAKGSWNPEGTYEKQTGGRVFATAMAVLILEQPVRHKRLGK